MTAAEHVRAGHLAEALTALNEEIRAQPGDPRLRVFLFQLNCVLGRWEKALGQLQTLASLNAETMLLAQIFRPVIECESFRREVFAGRSTPLIFGEPADWIGMLVQANKLIADGRADAAAELRRQAFDLAPASAGRVDGQPFEWWADSDTRLGPLLEVFMEGKYYWVPFMRITRIESEKPADLRDLVWLPVRIIWSNGGMVSAHVPTRYAGTEDSADDGLRLARKTTWKDLAPDGSIGLGQRVFATESGEYPILEHRLVEFNASA